MHTIAILPVFSPLGVTTAPLAQGGGIVKRAAVSRSAFAAARRVGRSLGLAFQRSADSTLATSRCGTGNRSFVTQSCGRHRTGFVELDGQIGTVAKPQIGQGDGSYLNILNLRLGLRLAGGTFASTQMTAQQRDVTHFDALASFGESPQPQTAAPFDAGGDSAETGTLEAGVSANGTGVDYVQTVATDLDGKRTLGPIVSAGTRSRGGALRPLSVEGDQASAASAFAKTLDVPTATGQRPTTVGFDADGVTTVTRPSLPSSVLCLSPENKTLQTGSVH